MKIFKISLVGIILIICYYIGRAIIRKTVPLYEALYFFIFAFLALMYFAFTESHKYWKLKKHKRFYNHPAFIIMLIILITFLIVLLVK